MSEKHNIDELFRSVLDKPIQNADPSAGWEAFENVHAAGSAVSVHKTAWLSAIASFAVVSMLTLINNPQNSGSDQIIAEKVTSLPSIVSFQNDEFATEVHVPPEDVASEAFDADLKASKPKSSQTQEKIADHSELQKVKSAQAANAARPMEDGIEEISLMAMNTHEFDFSQESALLLEEKSFEDEKLKLKLADEKNQIKLIASANSFNSVIGSANPGTANSMQAVGLEYQRNINEKLSFTLGLLYSHLGVSGFGNSYDSVAYSFGKTTYRTEISPSFTQNLSLPIGISYRPAYRHEVNLSAELGYLLDVHSIKTESVLGYETESPVIKESERGYQQGFHALNTRLMLSYRYQLTSGLQLGMSGRYTMTDMLDENYFDRKRKISPFFWQLELRYNLAKY